MDDVPPRLVEVGASFAQTYRPLLDLGDWMVAMLRQFDVVAPAKFHRVERHRNSDEVFILTAGTADLIVFDGDEAPQEPSYVLPMRANVAYNVRQAVWHHVVMSSDAHIVLFERSETSVGTTDYAALAPGQIAALQARFSVSREEG
ncbi:MAG: hypothetical protein ACRDJW_04505 [Thermomicrobiales bacterium]